MNNPFCYEPHPLCLMAAEEVRRVVKAAPMLEADAAKGKMLGVLVAEDGEGRLGYVAAFSGLLAGSNNHAFFVPPVFDSSQPDGYFKLHEAEITAINHEIDGMAHSETYLNAKAEADRCRKECEAEESRFRQRMVQMKAERDSVRHSDDPVSPEDEARMVRESQFMKAELRRIRKRNAERMAEASAAKEKTEAEIAALKARRKAMSDALQHWLFAQYKMLDALGNTRNLCSIFADTPQRVPPSGAGDCCAPKLLQYAYANHLRPVCMAEFWHGASPSSEVRHDGRFYPACRGKCLPILGHMLQGLDVEDYNAEASAVPPPEIVYEDKWLAVVLKPSGMKTVPGLSGHASLYEAMQERRGKGRPVFVAHRLDMDTSGLVVVAYDPETYKDLQRQFALHSVKKRYVALLDGVPEAPDSGEISLPLCPDPLNRPYQRVDREHGKESVTRYRIVERGDGFARVELFPLTGRTHQLRLHCAHACGLGSPIRGDRLYGHGHGRLCLHAERIAFVHPGTGKPVAFERKADF